MSFWEDMVHTFLEGELEHETRELEIHGIAAIIPTLSPKQHERHLEPIQESFTQKRSGFPDLFTFVHLSLLFLWIDEVDRALESVDERGTALRTQRRADCRQVLD